jgi:HK97 gp10 family phage protein
VADKKLTMSQLASLAKAAAKQVDPTVDKKLRTLAQVGVGLMKSEIQAMHAVDTGTMLNSTSAESVGKDTILIGPTVTYAAYVALGTSRMKARPFHIRSAQKLRAQAKEFMSAEDLGL